MMKTCIIYASKYGTAQQCAAYLQKEISCDIYSVKEHFDIAAYDRVILGSSVYAGTLRKELIRFCETHEQELLHKELAVYLCGLHTEPAVLHKELKENLPSNLIDHIQHTYGFGGILDVTKMNWMEKMLIKMINKKEKFLTLPIESKAYDFLHREEMERCRNDIIA